MSLGEARRQREMSGTESGSFSGGTDRPARIPVQDIDEGIQRPSRALIQPVELIDPVVIPPHFQHPTSPPEAIAHMYHHIVDDPDGALKKQGRGGEVERTAAQLRVLYQVAGGDVENFEETVESFHGKGRPSAMSTEEVHRAAAVHGELRSYEQADIDPFVRGTKRATSFADKVAAESDSRKKAVIAALDAVTSTMPTVEGFTDQIAHARAQVEAIDILVTVLAQQAERDGESVQDALPLVYGIPISDKPDVLGTERHLPGALEEYATSPEAVVRPDLYIKPKDDVYVSPPSVEGLSDIVSERQAQLLQEGRPVPLLVAPKPPKEKLSERPRLTHAQLQERQGGYGQVRRYAGTRYYYY